MALNWGAPQVRNEAHDYALKSLMLRLKAKGPHSLEVAESLSTLVLQGPSPGAPVGKVLCAQLQLPANLASTNMDDGGNERIVACREHIAKIREDILGSDSQVVADSLMGLGEQSKLRAVAIYERLYGSNCPSAIFAYDELARECKNPVAAREYARRARLGSALAQAKNDAMKRAYVYLNNALPQQRSMLISVFRSLGTNPAEIKDIEVGSDALGYVLDVKQLSIPKFDHLCASTSTSFDSDLGRDRLYLDDWKGNNARENFLMDLPTWGGDYNVSPDFPPVKVTGKGTICFRQEGLPEQGYQEINYKWNGKTFELVDAKPGKDDRKVVNAAIDDAVNGFGFYGIRGHHTVDHNLIKSALERAQSSARELVKNGHPIEAADRLWTMFELTSDITEESLTGEVVAGEDDHSRIEVPRWVQSWTRNTPVCSVNLTDKEWRPFLTDYADFLQSAGQLDRARAVREAVAKYAKSAT